MILGPFDKVGHDQEIPRKAHALDDIQLKVQSLLILLNRRGVGDHLQPLLQTFIGLTAQFLHLVIGEFRQDGITPIRHKGTAPGDFHRVFNRLRQIGEENAHLLCRFEIMLRRQLPARILLIHIGPVRDTDQRVMRLVHVRFREIDIVGGHQRQIHGIGHLDQPAFGQTFRLGLGAILARVSLQFHIEPVREDRLKPIHQRLRRGALACLKQHSHRAFGAAGQTDEPV